jgi:hypothetical protein
LSKETYYSVKRDLLQCELTKADPKSEEGWCAKYRERERERERERDPERGELVHTNTHTCVANVLLMCC